MADEQGSDQLQRPQSPSERREFGERPSHNDVVVELYGSELLHRKGLVARMEAVERKSKANKEDNEETRRQFKSILGNAKWLFIGLGINIAANLPSAVDWILARLP